MHPTQAEILPDTLFEGPLEEANPATFYSIDEQQILKAANHTKGSGGPSLLDAKQWKRMLTSNHFKTEGKELREELASYARKIATEVLDPKILETYTACRSIPLNKSPGDAELQVRPIGVGEVMRRIVGKTISWCLGEEIKQAAGPLQVSSGLKGGAEAAIHAMKLIFDKEGSDAIILVDAANAFNRLNRRAALHNIRYVCPPFSVVLINTYRTASRLFIMGGREIESTEGTTQGDTLAMQFYGISITPILQTLKQQITEVSQVWLADDATGAGKILPLKRWWDLIKTEGVKHGYHVNKPSKSWLILKDADRLEEVKEVFQNSPINITTSGKRHLGAALGSDEFKNSYIDEKVTDWCNNITKLSKIAHSQPHAAFAAFIHGEQHKYTYFMRTIPGINENLKPLDDAINNFITSLFGREVSDNERDLFAMPIKDGGLGIRKLSENTDISYNASTRITAPLIDEIVKQSDTLPCQVRVSELKAKTINDIKSLESNRVKELKEIQTDDLKRTLEQNSQPGASSWLGALPLQEQNFNLNKGEFQDAICLRYNMRPKSMPSKCPCGQPFDVTHALNCHRGGFVNARHDNIKNLEAKLLKSVCNDVEVEPQLQPVTFGGFQRSANTSDEARPDIRARGFWRDGQNAYFDVRVTNADCDSQKTNSITSVLRKHEQEKKRQYNQRIMEIELGTFTPLVFTTTGIMGHECSLYHKALAEKISRKKGDRYEDVMRYMRIKISFLIR